MSLSIHSLWCCVPGLGFAFDLAQFWLGQQKVAGFDFGFAFGLAIVLCNLRTRHSKIRSVSLQLVKSVAP
jgi:cyanate permease